MTPKELLIKEQQEIMNLIHNELRGHTFSHEHTLIKRLDEIETELARIEFDEWISKNKGNMMSIIRQMEEDSGN